MIILCTLSTKAARGPAVNWHFSYQYLKLTYVQSAILTFRLCVSVAWQRIAPILDSVADKDSVQR